MNEGETYSNDFKRGSIFGSKRSIFPCFLSNTKTEKIKVHSFWKTTKYGFIHQEGKKWITKVTYNLHDFYLFKHTTEE